MELVDTENRDNDTDQFHIGFFAQAVGCVVINKRLRDAILVRDDSVHGIHDTIR